MKRAIRWMLGGVLVMGLGLLVGLGHGWAAPTAADGDLDPSFGQDGKVLAGFPITGTDSIRAVAVQTDGKIVAVGSIHGHFGVARYNPDGSLDRGFGEDGKIGIQFGDGN